MSIKVASDEPIRIDIGCGKNKKPEFIGVDQYPMEGVDIVMNIADDEWPWEGSSVSEVNCSHFLEHLTGLERVRFFNKLHRVLMPGAKALLVVPHWASNRAYGDFTHQWPPVSEMLFYYINKTWRESQAPHNDIRWNPEGYCCHFEATWGYSLHPEILLKNAQAQQFAIQFYKEACQDQVITLTKLPKE